LRGGVVCLVHFHANEDMKESQLRYEADRNY